MIIYIVWLAESLSTITVFTWLNAGATISHLCKMTAAAIKGGYYI